MGKLRHSTVILFANMCCNLQSDTLLNLKWTLHCMSLLCYNQRLRYIQTGVSAGAKKLLCYKQLHCIWQFFCDTRRILAGNKNVLCNIQHFVVSDFVISNFDCVIDSHILLIWPITVTLTLKTANQSFRKTLWFMMTYQHTKCGLKNIIWTNIHRCF